MSPVMISTAQGNGRLKEDAGLYSLGVRSRPTAYLTYEQVSEHT